MKKISHILKKVIIIVVFGAVVFVAGTMYAKHNNKTNTAITDTTIKNSLNAISELATADYHYTKVGKFSNSLKFSGWTIPFTQKSFLITYEGDVKAGYDLTQAKIAIRGKKITITLPAVKVIANTIDENTIKVYDETNNIFNSIKITDYKSFALKQKSKAKSEAIKNGLYTKAYKQVQTLITAQVNALNKDYSVTIKQAS